MRQSEIERLNALRAKKANGTELNEKESARLIQLEKLEKEESLKNESKTNNVLSGRPGEQSSAARPGNNNANSGSADNTRGREESRSGSGTKRAERNKSNTDSAKLGGDAKGNSGQASGIAGASKGGIGLGGDNNREHGIEIRGIEFEVSDTDRDSAGDKGQQVLHGSINQVGSPKPIKAKVNSKKKQTGKEITPENLYAAILQTGFGTIAMVTAKPHWNIAEDEAQSVAEPLSKMLDGMSNANKKKLEKMTNPIMLGAAVLGIVVPRIMVDMAQMKGAKKIVQPIPTNGTTLQANPIGVGDITTDIKLGDVKGHEGDSDSSSTSTPLVDGEITKLINSGNQ